MRLQGRNLFLQMEGEDVALLRGELGQLGFNISPEETARRFFGKSTHEAMTLFQRQQGLEPTGVVDECTTTQINPTQPRSSFIVNGLIRQQVGQAVPNVIVKAYDQDLRRQELLGEAITTENGAYEIPYTANQFARAEKESADLLVRVFSLDRVQLAASDILFNAPAQARINLTIVPSKQPQLSEFEQLVAQLAPIVQDVPLAELTEEDLGFLVGETGLDRQRIEFLAQAARLARDTDLPTEVFHGFARQGLPLELEALLAKGLTELRHALESAIDANIIPARLRASLDEIMERLEQLSLERGTMVTYAFFGQFLNQEISAPLAGYTVRAFDLDAGPEPKDLGFDITNATGLFTVTYTAPRLAGSDAGGENAPTRRLRLHIIDPKGEEIHQVEVQAKVGESQMVEIRVPVPEVPEPPSPSLQEFDSTLQLQLPPEWLAHLANQGLRTLGDILKVGSISRIENLPVPPNHPRRPDFRGTCQPQHLAGRPPGQPGETWRTSPTGHMSVAGQDNNTICTRTTTPAYRRYHHGYHP